MVCNLEISTNGSSIIRDIGIDELKPDDYKGEFGGTLGNDTDDSTNSKFIGH